MAEYIEREAAIDRLEKLFQLQAATARAIIEAIPAADVAPVRHGRNISNSGFLCSECHFGDFGGFYGYKPNYCPNCGAKMEEA